MQREQELRTATVPLAGTIDTAAGRMKQAVGDVRAALSERQEAERSEARAGGGDVLSASGERLGGVGQVFLDDTTGDPAWVTVKTGLFGTKESFVPLQGAGSRGDDIVVSYDKATVENAPRIDDNGTITPEEEGQLYTYYGMGAGGTLEEHGVSLTDKTSGEERRTRFRAVADQSDADTPPGPSG